jgi:glycosyltransferase involved in cell wall biosynthesis
LGISGSVEWAGQVAGQRKAQLLADAEIFVLPSFSENFGIAAAEALLAGKACLFSPGVAVGAEAAAHGAACLAGPDSANLARTLAALMDSAADRAYLSVQARRYSECELSAGVMATRLKALYEAILAGSNLPPHS